MTETAAPAEADRHDVVDHTRLQTFADRLFQRHGMSSDDAARIAHYFVWVELHGLSFLGARRIPEFIARLREGGTNGTADGNVTRVHERDAFAVIDAGDTLAQVTGTRAMELAVDKARSAGAGIVVVRNVTTAGALGYFAMLAAERGMIGMAINNTPPVMLAWGGAQPVMGAQPFSVACPAGRHQPLYLDMTNSVMSMARMYEYQRRGEEIPEDAALTIDGAPTVDPATAIAGILLPMAGHRGYGLALLWEALTGVLAGGQRFGADVGWPADHGQPMAVSLFLMAIDPTTSMPYETFTARVDDLIDQMHASPPAPGVERILVPGERSQATAAARRDGGIPIPRDIVATLEAVGSEVGVPW
ncbi:MAG: Ldh family oxidoreductase [Acidimicrobiales bacterium]